MAKENTEEIKEASNFINDFIADRKSTRLNSSHPK